MIANQTRAARWSNPPFIDSPLERITGGDGGQRCDRHAAISDADDLSSCDSAQVFRQVLFEFPYSDVYVDTLITK